MRIKSPRNIEKSQHSHRNYMQLRFSVLSKGRLHISTVHRLKVDYITLLSVLYACCLRRQCSSLSTLTTPTKAPDRRSVTRAGGNAASALNDRAGCNRRGMIYTVVTQKQTCKSKWQKKIILSFFSSANP